MRKLIVSCVAALALAAPLAACSSSGSISRASAKKQLEDKASSTQEKAVADCIVSKLYDSGKFSKSEIQKVVKANKDSDLSKDLNTRFTNDVVTPCTEQISGSTDTSGSTDSSGATDTSAGDVGSLAS